MWCDVVGGDVVGGDGGVGGRGKWCAVRQLRHYFGSFLTWLPSPMLPLPPTRRVTYAPLSAHAWRVLIGAYDPVL